MSDDYLWDGSGTPDPDVEKLERALGPYRHARPASDIPSFPRLSSRFRFGFPPTRVAATAAVAAIALLAAGAGAWFIVGSSRPTWEVVRLEGTPRVGSATIAGNGILGVGEWLTTDGSSRARIDVGLIGQVEVEPNTRLRLLRAAPTDHRLSLARGILHARIWAPPRLFAVETPWAVATDLGCAYTLEVDAGGSSLLTVTSGWVSFERDGRESFVPAGAVCVTRPQAGPGTPCYADASEALRSGLAKLDFERLPASERRAALSTVIAESRRRDALTLWHLLERTEGQERGVVFDGLAALIPPPDGVTREGVMRGERSMIESWWASLGLGDATWWRLWKLPAAPSAS